MKSKTLYVLVGLMTYFQASLMAQSSYIDYSALTILKQFYETERLGKLVMQDNEFEPNNSGYMSRIYANPLLLNGTTLIYGNFNLSSRGILTIVKGNPETSTAQKIPFYVLIRRNGKMVEAPTMKFKNKKLYKIEVSEIFKFCEPNDILILKPANPEDWRAKRVLKLLGAGC